MNGARTIKLSAAQVSALECREDGLDPLTLAAWKDGGRKALVFPALAAAAIADELMDASNSEDAQAEMIGCKYARRAARSLAVLSVKAARIAASHEELSR